MIKGIKKSAIPLFQAGCIGFGGGSALIPVLHEKTVKTGGLVTEEEFNKAVTIATITPGALPVEIAAGIGRKYGGCGGMLLGAASLSLPGTLIVISMVAILSRFGDFLTQEIGFIAIGISAYIIYVLIEYVAETVKTAYMGKNSRQCILTVLVVFCVTCEKQLYSVLGWDVTPIFGLSAVDVMGVALFMIFWTCGRWKSWRVAVGWVVSLLYCLCAGGIYIFREDRMKTAVIAVMLILSIVGLIQSIRENSNRISVWKSRIWGSVSAKMIKECLAALLFLFICSVPALLLCEKTASFILKGCLSSVLSFGGGDSYLAVAGSMFVSSGMILYRSFYTYIVPAANASPGSILCEVLSGVGYFLGYESSGNVTVGLAVALCGYVCAVAMSCITFSVADFLYEGFEALPVYSLLKKMTRPVVSGLLLTVCIGFMKSCLETGQSCDWPELYAPLLCVALSGVIWLAARKTGKRLFYMAPLSAAASFVCCHMLTIFY